MSRRIRIPIRLKFLLTFLVLVTVVVGLITFSTAGLFREDKATYVSGLTSMVALGTAEESRSTLAGYRERLALYARLVAGGGTAVADREAVTRVLFDEFPELVALVLDRGDGDPVRVYNLSLLDSVELKPEDLARLERERPIAIDQLAADRSFVRNTPVTPRMPTFTLAFRPALAEDAAPMLVRALLRSDNLRQLVMRFSAYEQFLVDSEGHLLAHADATRLARDESPALPAAAARVHEQSSAGVTLQHRQGDTELIAGYAGAEFAGVIAGAHIPASATNLASRQVITRLLWIAAALMVLTILVSVFWAHRITGPMERLSDATRTVARGEFEVEVGIESNDELGDLAASFRSMAGELRSREQALTEAHGQLVQSEKMAAFGQLGAGIAHEVKNPLAGILACAQLAAEEVPEESTVYQDLKLIEKESKRCKQIIENLLKFARTSRSEMVPTDLNQVLEDAIAIVQHQLELNEVRIERDLQPDTPRIHANANQLQQVFMNVLINAQQAMAGKPGKVRIASRPLSDQRVEVRLADTGPGIPEEIKNKIFEPFFTTKPVGQGTGLGLSVSYGIIRDHAGEIAVETEAGKGTTFVITLPVFALAGAEPAQGEAVPEMAATS